MDVVTRFGPVSTSRIQYDQSVFNIYLAIYNTENLHNSIKNMPKWFQIFAKC